MNINRMSGWKFTILSGEGVIAQPTGPGKVIMQSRNPSEFASWLGSMLPSTYQN